MKKLLLACLAALLPATAHAGTFTIDRDMGPGADFPQVIDAVASPLVLDGDTLLIRPGSYTPFTTVGKSLNLRGLGATPGEVKFQSTVSPNMQFWSCGKAMTLTNLELQSVSFVDCSSSVLLLDVEMESITGRNVSHLRTERQVLAGVGTFAAVISEQTHSEFLNCNLVGRTPFASSSGSPGWPGVSVSTGSYARFANCNITGGPGGASFTPGPEGGAGGIGLLVGPNSLVHLIGDGDEVVRGGQGVQGGKGGAAASVDSTGTLRLSNYVLLGGLDHLQVTQATAYLGLPSSLVIPLIPDPMLTRTGSTAPGAISTFHLFGDPGATVIAFLGTQFLAAPLPNIVGLLSTNYTGPFFTGQMNASGQLDFDLRVPLGTPRGAVATMQSGLIYVTDGSLRLTNPTTILVL